jgi:hypothetical protein
MDSIRKINFLIFFLQFRIALPTPTANPIPSVVRTYWESGNVRLSVTVTLAPPTRIVEPPITSANASAGPVSPVTPTTVTVAAPSPKINARRIPSVAKSKFVNRTATESAVASPSARQFDAEPEPFAWRTTTPPSALARQLAFTLATLPDRKVVAKSSAWQIAIALERNPATEQPTPANPSASKTVAAKMQFAWPRTTWPCAPARLDWSPTLTQKSNAFQLTFALLNLVTPLPFGNSISNLMLLDFQVILNFSFKSE